MRFSPAFHLRVNIDFAAFLAVKTLPKLHRGFELKLVVMV